MPDVGRTVGRVVQLQTIALVIVGAVVPDQLPIPLSHVGGWGEYFAVGMGVTVGHFLFGVVLEVGSTGSVTVTLAIAYTERTGSAKFHQSFARPRRIGGRRVCDDDGPGLRGILLHARSRSIQGTSRTNSQDAVTCVG